MIRFANAYPNRPPLPPSIKVGNRELMLSPDDVTRFFSKVKETESGCWEWTGARNKLGYGRIRVGIDQRGNAPAHRFAYIVLVGPVPDGLVLDHLCRNPPCANPAHLEAVTVRENTLRGTSQAAINAAKTHCDQGHEFTPENTHTTTDGRRACRECGRARDKAAREAKGEEYRARDRAWYAANREEINAKRRARWAENPEESRARQRASREPNRDKRAAQERARREADRDEINARRREQRAANRDEINARKRAAYAAKRGNTA